MAHDMHDAHDKFGDIAIAGGGGGAVGWLAGWLVGWLDGLLVRCIDKKYLHCRQERSLQRYIIQRNGSGSSRCLFARSTQLNSARLSSTCETG